MLLPSQFFMLSLYRRNEFGERARIQHVSKDGKSEKPQAAVAMPEPALILRRANVSRKGGE
jgi:hypothetical protein